MLKIKRLRFIKDAKNKKIENSKDANSKTFLKIILKLLKLLILKLF
uniref:Uncharacterized protein n=1 Tax=viral metagenome TaxID=1070528 RepID=A0A6C0E0U4_9ZZZZ